MFLPAVCFIGSAIVGMISAFFAEFSAKAKHRRIFFFLSVSSLFLFFISMFVLLGQANYKEASRQFNHLGAVSTDGKTVEVFFSNEEPFIHNAYGDRKIITIVHNRDLDLKVPKKLTKKEVQELDRVALHKK